MKLHHVISAVLLVLAACSQTSKVVSPTGMCSIDTPSCDNVVVFGNRSFIVEVADIAETRAQGLMNRSMLDENAGMLFVFDKEQKPRFWMKNTRIPLDIVFMAADGTIVDIKQMLPCHEDPCVHYESAAPAMYALEVNAGEAASLKPGDKGIIKLSSENS